MGPHLRMMVPFFMPSHPQSYLLPPSSFVLPRNFIVFYHLNTLVFRIFFVPLHTIKALD